MSISHLRLEATATFVRMSIAHRSYLLQLEVAAFFGGAHDAVNGVFGDEVAFDGAAFDGEFAEAE